LRIIAITGLHRGPRLLVDVFISATVPKFRREEFKLPTRRQFSKCLVAASTTLLDPGNIWTATASSSQSDNEVVRTCDLLIKGGTVIDPSQNLHSPLDVAVKDGTILEIAADIPVSRARKAVSAKGKIVTPGLIDVHVHIYEGVGSLGVNADHFCLARGVTTAVDSASAGYATIAGLRKYVIGTSATRLYASMDSGALGLITFTENLEWMNPQLAAEAANHNKPAVVAITARLSRTDAGTNDLEILKRARTAAEASSLPIMVHAQGTYSPLSEILKIMRKGDVLTHCFHNRPYGLLDGNRRVLPEVREARERGIYFSVGHGSRFSFDVAEACIQQDFMADAISSDIEANNVAGPVFDLPTTLSKFLLLGLDLDKVIEHATIKPAHIFSFGQQLGTLRPGSVADIAVLALHEGKFPLADSSEQRMGRQMLMSVATVRDGTLYVNRSDEFGGD
jgi:dihydroorotase